MTQPLTNKEALAAFLLYPQERGCRGQVSACP